MGSDIADAVSKGTKALDQFLSEGGGDNIAGAITKGINGLGSLSGGSGGGSGGGSAGLGDLSSMIPSVLGAGVMKRETADSVESDSNGLRDE